MPSKCSTLLHQGYPPPQAPSSVLSTVSSSQGELFSAFTYVPSSKQATLNTKKFPHHNPMLADQSSSSADSGVHSSSTQSPIVKHSLRQYDLSSLLFLSYLVPFRCQVHGFSFDRPSSAHAHDNQDTHFYATYDQQFAFLRFVHRAFVTARFFFFVLQRDGRTSRKSGQHDTVATTVVVISKPSPRTIFLSLKSKKECLSFDSQSRRKRNSAIKPTLVPCFYMREREGRQHSSCVLFVFSSSLFFIFYI